MKLLRTIAFGSTVLATLSIAACSGILGINSNPVLEVQEAGSGLCTGTVYARIASDFSGTATDIAIPHFWGIYDYIRHLNDEGEVKGGPLGIRGCHIDVDVQDNHYTGPVTQDVVNKWQSTDPHWNDVSTLFIFGTGPTTTVGPGIMTQKKVIIPGSYAGSLASPAAIDKSVNYDQVNSQFSSAPLNEEKKSPGWPYIFFPATDYGTAIRLAIQAAWKLNPGPMAFAHDTAANCAYCVDPLAAGASYLPSLQGMKLAREIVIKQTSATADAQGIIDKVHEYFHGGTDYPVGEIDYFKTQNATSWKYDPVVWFWSGNSVYATAILAQAIAGVQKEIDADSTIKGILQANPGHAWKIRVIANNWGIGETTTTICGEACSSDVIYGLFPVPHYGDPAAAGMAALTALHDVYGPRDQTSPPPAPITKRNPDDYRDVRYVQGVAAAAMWARAMGNAIDKLASARPNQPVPPPTGDDLKNALEGFKQQDLNQLTAGPITFSATDHRPQSNEGIYKVNAQGLLEFVDHYQITLVDDWLGY